jgi:RNA polymerase sigma-70 factor (ECF subfamily)
MNRQGEPIEAIVERLRDEAGREESFRLLFDRFYGPLYRFFEHRGFSREECQDLIQETFLRVYRSCGAFRGEARWEHWLFRIAANTASKAWRRSTAAKRGGRSDPCQGEDGEGSPPAGAGETSPGAEAPSQLRRLLDSERKELLIRALDGLPAQMRRCVRLRMLQDLDHVEIAEILQISPSTVKVQLFKARKRLRLELADNFAGFDL